MRVVSARDISNVEVFELLSYLDVCVRVRNQVPVLDFVFSLDFTNNGLGVTISLKALDS